MLNFWSLEIRHPLPFHKTEGEEKIKLFSVLSVILLFYYWRRKWEKFTLSEKFVSAVVEMTDFKTSTTISKTLSLLILLRKATVKFVFAFFYLGRKL